MFIYLNIEDEDYMLQRPVGPWIQTQYHITHDMLITGDKQYIMTCTNASLKHYQVFPNTDLFYKCIPDPKLPIVLAWNPCHTIPTRNNKVRCVYSENVPDSTFTREERLHHNHTLRDEDLVSTTLSLFPPRRNNTNDTPTNMITMSHTPNVQHFIASSDGSYLNSRCTF